MRQEKGEKGGGMSICPAGGGRSSRGVCWHLFGEGEKGRVDRGEKEKNVRGACVCL